MQLTGLLKSLRALSFNAGREFEVVNVSFDTREKPPLAAAKKASYMKGYGRPGTEAGWHFLTGDPPAIQRLTNAAGYRFEYDPRTDQFSHASGIMIVTPDGRLARYFYGIEYSTRDLRLGLVEASAGKVGSRIDQALLFCFDYDPQTGKYSMAILRTIRLMAILLLGVMLWLVFRSLHRERRKRGYALSGQYQPGRAL
jgi:protein SCO1/2